MPTQITVRHIGIEKRGRSAAANAGLDSATGDYIGFLDDDDELYPHHVETLARLLDKNEDAAGAYSAAHEVPVGHVQAQGRRDASLQDPSLQQVFFTPALASYVLIWQNLFPIQSVLFRRTCLSIHRFDTNLDAIGDWLFWLQMFLEKKLVWTPQVTSRYFVSSDPAAHAARLAQHKAAEPYFHVQRTALLTERGMENWQNLHRHYCQMLDRTYLSASGQTPPMTPRRNGSAGLGAKPTDLRLAQALDLDPIPDISSRTASTVVFTSINLRYLPKALVLAETLKQTHPNWDFHILLNDALSRNHAVLANVDVVFPIRGCGIDNFHGWCFGHDVVEMCTATKAFYTRHLLEMGVANVIYLDPDIAVLGSLAPLLDELAHSSLVLTPHSYRPAVRDSEIFYTEMSLLAHGVFNLGFMAVHNDRQGRRIVEYLCRRMQAYCHDDHARGLFTDQKWFNLVPVLFDGVKILKQDGYNAASWNISNWPIRKIKGALHAGTDLLRFFHFSGYDAAVPRRMFEIFGQYNDDLAQLLTWYRERVDHYEAAAKPLASEWAFSRFSNGTPIKKGIRRFYRRALEHRLAYPEPFFAEAEPSFLRHAAAYGLDELEQRFNSALTMERYF